MRKRSVSGVRKVREVRDSSDNNPIQSEHSGSLLRSILDEAGFETGVGTYTYSDMIGSVRNTFESVSTSILNGISGAISNMNICGQIADMNESVEQYLVQNFDQMGDNPNDQLRDIANSLRVQMEDNIRSKIESPEYNIRSKIESPEGYGSPVINHNPPLPSFSPAPPVKQRKYPDVEIKINVYGYVEQVKIKYNDKYLSVPFENSDNPYYIQEIFDEWFIINEYEYIEATYDIYEALIDISSNVSIEWLETNVEWIGFSYDGNSMTPSSFEVFKY